MSEYSTVKKIMQVDRKEMKPMELTTQKKVWVTPELIVLVRTSPQEAVLAGCSKPARPTGIFGDTCSIGQAGQCSKTTSS
jgi:hypothetical protein